MAEPPTNTTAASTASSPSSTARPFKFSLLYCLLTTIGAALVFMVGMEYQKRNMLMINPGSIVLEVQRMVTIPDADSTKEELKIQRELQQEEELPQGSPTTIREDEYPRIEFSPEYPIFSLSLPNSGLAILPRYFECAGRSDAFGRYWSSHNTTSTAFSRKPIGKCLQENLRSRANNTMQRCGNFEVWHDLQYLQPPPPGKLAPRFKGGCFDPVVFPGALEQMYQAKPNATVLVHIPEPAEWYKTLSYDLHHYWNTLCNPTHNNLFPTEKTEVAYLNFYERYHQRIRDFVAKHPSWTLIELDLAKTPLTTIASRLEQQLGIEAKCWMDSVQGSIPLYGTDQSNGNNQVERPNDVTYPILVVSLPKSGTSTTHSYFNCQLGKWNSFHQWTKRHLTAPTTEITIGECMQLNIQDQLPLLHNCGTARVYSDIGITNTKHGQCYYPQLHGGLQKFAEAYPQATILLVVRNSTDWVSSAKRWNNLKERWAQNPICRKTNTFPRPRSPDSKWEAFYENNTRTVRDFVRSHPTLKYIEALLGDDTGDQLNHILGFTKSCWGHKNANTGTVTSVTPNKRANPGTLAPLTRSGRNKRGKK